ncbi:MAG: NAD(P)-dependent alcohol dehydrogenase [Novosphingobium sp.]
MVARPQRRGVRLKVQPSSISLQSFEEVLPAPLPDEVVVEVRASSLNYHDYLVLTGAIPVADGRIPLSDGAGTVVAAGSAVKEFALGDNVLGIFFPDWVRGKPTPETLVNIAGDSVDGFAASHVVMPERRFTPMPEGLGFMEAATIPCAGVTAWTALTGDGGIEPGDVVVIQGSGGVAIWTLQLAKSMGARVIALTSSREKSATLASLGADLTIDYKSQPDWALPVIEFTGGAGADLIVDVVGGAGFSQSIAACRMGGRIAAIGFLADTIAPVAIPDLLLRHIRISGRAVGSREDQENLVKYISGKSINPVVGKSFYMEKLSDAFKEFERNETVGKISIVN